MMTVQVIYTFENKPQVISEMPILGSVLDNKKIFFQTITENLNKKEKETLVKLSCCIYNSKRELRTTHWYNKSNGKFWDDEIPKFIKELYDIECTYEPINK